MARSPDWPARLCAYIAARQRAPFKWGKRAQDCASFAFGWALEATGIDAMADVPDYASAEEADLLLDDPGFERVLDAHFSRRDGVGLAQRGDLALADINGQLTLTIVLGDELVGPGRRRLEYVPRAAMQAAWEV